MTEVPSGPVLCFGEILWDSLPQGLYPGGAPMNVAYHLARLGVPAFAVTAVGRDTLGCELLRRFAEWGIETSFVTALEHKPTGLARVALHEGNPVFEIVEDAAWDFIVVSPELLDLAGHASALVFGTLAQRSEHNQRQLAALQARSRGALKILDVNLRPPFDEPDRVWALARTADVIKLNHQELGRLLERDVLPEELEAAAREFSARTYCTTICVTAGPRGAGLLENRKWFWEEGRPVEVKDTVGAGDAFLAALVQGLRERVLSPAEMLERACRVAEFVASRPGATPNYRIDKAGAVEPLP
jgi:fructokinase